jgi:hypothetical protein
MSTDPLIRIHIPCSFTSNRFWPQWLYNPLSISPTMKNIRTLSLIFEGSPPPHPEPVNFMGMFSDWPNLETLEIVNLTFTDDMDSHIQAVDEAVPIIPQNKIRTLVIRGNIAMMVPGLRALQAPLEKLCLYDIQVLSQNYMLKALWIVGASLKTLSIDDQGGWMTTWGPFAQVFTGLEKLIPNVHTLEMGFINFPESISGLGVLPRGLKRLVITEESSLDASQTVKLLDEIVSVDRLTELKEVKWVSSKFGMKGWAEIEIEKLREWGIANFIDIDVRHYKQ